MQRHASRDENDDVVLRITMQLEGGIAHDIVVRENESAQEVARRFVAEHNLDENVVQNLADHINRNLSTSPPVRGRRSPVSRRTLSPPHERAFVDPRRSDVQHFANQMDAQMRHRIQRHDGAPNINNTSKRLARNRSSSAGRKDVFERLHTQGELRKKRRAAELKRIKDAEEAIIMKMQSGHLSLSPGSRALSIHRTLDEAPNWGCKLYEQSLSSRNEWQRAAAQAKKKKDEDELKEATFKPKITEHAKLFYQRKINSRGESVTGEGTKMPLTSRSVNSTPHYAVGKEPKTEETTEQRELHQCTFKPELAAKSEAMVKKWRSQKSFVIPGHAWWANTVMHSFTDADFRALAALQLQA